jgi:hypothetical protein
MRAGRHWEEFCWNYTVLLLYKQGRSLIVVLILGRESWLWRLWMLIVKITNAPVLNVLFSPKSINLRGGQ